MHSDDFEPNQMMCFLRVLLSTTRGEWHLCVKDLGADCKSCQKKNPGHRVP